MSVQEENHIVPAEDTVTRKPLYRVISAFWLLGLCNNFIYVVMLSGAHDIISHTEHGEASNVSAAVISEELVYDRDCHATSTGAILLADIVPTLLVKFIAPFLPFYIHIRMVLVIISNVVALVLVANASSMTMALIGVCFASFGSGLGEITLLAYSTSFTLHAISGWSSGTGGAGIAGSFAYAGMIEGGLTPQTAMLVSLVAPGVMMLVFWVLLPNPNKLQQIPSVNDVKIPQTQQSQSSNSEEKLDVTLLGAFLDKFYYIPKLLKYMIPVGLVYLFEYLINSGVFELLVFENTTIHSTSQFRWYNAMYQIGVFVSRSSIVLLHFKRIYMMAVFQAINLTVFTLEAVYGFIPNVWIMFGMIFWEGLLGGAAYANTFYNMSNEVEENRRLFALGIASVADSCGIVLAGFLAFPVHNAICQLPYNPIFRWP